jgi:predicted ATPase/class 3 adenylate cyclase
MESPSAYIPSDRRQAILRGENLPHRSTGAALFADISGFTPLTEALLKAYGPKRGPEELTKQLNYIYDVLVSDAHRYDGSVIAFSGDAITCWLDGDDGLRAIACGLAMQQTMNQFAAIQTPSGQTIALAMKAAVAVGSVRRFQVGDPQIQYIDVLAGATLDRMAAAEHHAARGEVVIAPEVVEQIGHRVEVIEWREDEETGHRFGVVARLVDQEQTRVEQTLQQHTAGDELLPEAQTRPWLLPPVYERLSAGKGSFLAELRPAVALFLSFGGIDYDGDEAAGEKLDSYIRWVQKVLVRYDAYLLQLTIGDKGSYLYAAFGAPAAHEDDSLRAVSAALELQTLPPQLNFIKQVHIGISQGQMRTGAYGGVKRRTYGVLGDEVNMAARLMQAAQPGQILVKDTVWHATGEAFSGEPLPPFKVKGKTEPVTTFSVTGLKMRRAIHLQEPKYGLPMVGRAAELALVEAKIEDMFAGHGQVVAIVAEAGMGKSRLVAEVVRLANEKRLVGYGGECQSYGTNISYLVWHSIWRGFFNVDPGWEIEEQLKELEFQLGLVDPALLPRLPLLGAALNLSIPDNELTGTFDAKLRKTSLESLLVDCLRAHAKIAPLLFVLEDCHWLDPLSHDLLEVIGRAIADLPVLIVMAYRPFQLERLKEARLEKLPYFTEIPLTEFTPDEAQRLIGLKLEQFFGSGTEASPALIRRITARAQGNPFYIEELLNYLQGQHFDPTDTEILEHFELPTSLHSLILSRIDQLTEHQKSTIKVASVIGRLFEAAWLWGMYPELGEPEQIKADLEALNSLDLVPEDKPEPELAYIFKHIATQEVAYESLPYAMRALLHGQLGQFIEQRYQDKLDRFVNLLAFHYDRSENQPKKCEYLRKAGEAAQAEYANEAAIDFYRRVLELLPAAEKEGVMVRLGEVLALLGQYDEALSYYHSARELLEGPEAAAPPSNHYYMTELCRKIAEVYDRRSEYDLALEWLQKGLNYLNEDGPSIEVARLLSLWALVHRHQGKNEEAIAQCQKSLTIATQIKTREGEQAMAQAYYSLGALYWRRGELSQAEHFCHESVRLYQKIEDIVGLSDAYNNLSIVYGDLGNWEQAGNALRESLTLKHKIGDIFGQGMMANNLGYLLLDRGEWDQAAHLFEESHLVWKQVGSAWGEAVILSNLAQVRIYQENWNEAFLSLSRSEAIFAEIGSEEFLPELERRWGEYYLKTGELDQALDHTRRSIALAEAQEVRLEEGMSYRILGRVYMARQEWEQAKVALHQSLQILDELNSEYEAAKTIVPLVRLALENGSMAADRERLAQAIQIFEKLGAKADLSQARALAAQLN